MMMCWKRYASERPHFAQIVDVIASFLEHVNNKRDSYYSDDDDEDLEEVLQRRNSRPSRTSSVRSGKTIYSSINSYLSIYNSVCPFPLIHLSINPCTHTCIHFPSI